MGISINGDGTLAFDDAKAQAKLNADPAVNGILVRTKSELIIANLLAGQGIPFGYEVPLRAADGTFYLPDFTIVARGETWYWEHVGRLDSDAYRNHWETKQAWYDRFFPGRLIVTHETGDLSQEVHRIIKQSFA